jgi:hypothetical protein
MATVATPEPGGPQFVWPWDTVKNDHLSLGEVRAIVAALSDWLHVSDDGSELGIARRLIEMNGRDRKIHAIKEIRNELRARGFTDFSLGHVKALCDQVWAEKGWTTWS